MTAPTDHATHTNAPQIRAARWPTGARRLVAILRGITPEETPSIVQALIETGITAIEIPLNSPDPFASIRAARQTAPAPSLIGAGTVLTADEAARVLDLGGDLIVSPNTDPDVIRVAAAGGAVSLPGAYTASEAFMALKAGASGLKLFPASVLGPPGVAALRAVLPDDALLCAVGGVGPDDFADYARVGVSAFGLGSALYKPGLSADALAPRAVAAVAAYDAVFSGADG